MEAFLLVLPGYIFWWFYKNSDDSGDVLKRSHWFFAIPFSAFGLTFFLINYVIISFFYWLLVKEPFLDLVKNLAGNKAYVSFIFGVTCFTGFILGEQLVKKIDLQKYLQLFIPKDLDNFAWLRKRLEEYGLVIITLKNNKVYYGATSLLTKGYDKEEVFLEFRPLASGYRNTKNHKIVVTSTYDEEVSRELKEEKSSGVAKNFSVIFPVREIVSITRYDILRFPHTLLYQEYLQQLEEEKAIKADEAEARAFAREERQSKRK